MKTSPIQKAVVQFQTEFSSKMLIILYMNSIQINGYSVKVFDPETGLRSPYPAEGTIYISYSEDEWIVKWGIKQSPSALNFQIELAIFNPAKLPPALIGMNGQLLSNVTEDLKRTIPFFFKENEADEIAESIVKWLFIKLGKITEENKG